jgi:hypothetical protein
MPELDETLVLEPNLERCLAILIRENAQINVLSIHFLTLLFRLDHIGGTSSDREEVVMLLFAWINTQKVEIEEDGPI